MKILHTSDLHFRKHWFEWIATQQDSYDVFCITGDFLDDAQKESLSEQIEWVSKWMREFKKPLFVCSGNHDVDLPHNQDWLNAISNTYADNFIKSINGVKFGCVPYLAPEFLEFDECDVLLYHLPPSNTKTAIHKTKNVDWGDKELYRALKRDYIKPKYLLCGHMHHPLETEDKLNNTTIINSGVDKASAVPLVRSLVIV